MKRSAIASQDDILDAIEKAVMFGAGNMLREHERELGFKPVFPGEVPWLTKSDWPDDVVITPDGKKVRIIAIYAKRPGNGAFSRPVTNILVAGLIPVVVAPMGDMVGILQRWGWHHQIVGGTFQDRRDEWFPTRKWRVQRHTENSEYRS